MSIEGDSSVVSGHLRIAALSIASYDLLSTCSREWKVLRNSSVPIVQRVLLLLSRYLGLVALILTTSFYYGSFTDGACRQFHITPGILQFIAGVVSQAAIFYRVTILSKCNKNVIGILAFLIIVATPLQAIAISVNRLPIVVSNQTTTSGCLSLVPRGRFDAGPVFYLTHLIFNFAATVLSIYYLTVSADFNSLPKLLTKNGVCYIVFKIAIDMLSLLASLDIRGIKDMGSVVAILCALLVAQYLMFIVPETPSEDKEAMDLSPTIVYHQTDATAVNSRTSLPPFGPVKRVQTMPLPAAHRHSSSGSGLHSCIGREALTYRGDGDVHMFKALKQTPGSEDSRSLSLHTNTRPNTANTGQAL